VLIDLQVLTFHATATLSKFVSGLPTMDRLSSSFVLICPVSRSGVVYVTSARIIPSFVKRIRCIVHAVVILGHSLCIHCLSVALSTALLASVNSGLIASRCIGQRTDDSNVP